MGKDKTEKTNVMRLLDQKKIEYKHYTYGDGVTALSGVEVANELGLNPDQVFKTLVTYGSKTKQYYVFVIPVAMELKLKKAAAASGEKNIEMLKQKELLPLTGYVHGGCSPIGMKKAFRTFLDESAILYDAIVFSAGRIGNQVELSSEDLKKIVDLTYADLC